MPVRTLPSTARNPTHSSLTAEEYIDASNSTTDTGLFQCGSFNHFRLTSTENCINATLLSSSFSSVSSSSSPLTPSTYNWAALGLFLIVVMTIGGNVLVCLAVCYKRKLQNMFNYFLVSLALSDMLSATIVMPLSIIKATIDQFPVPKLICVAWYSLDVLFTSSTICHLCMISIDRYMTLTYPLKYGHSKKKKHTMLKIAVVWMISFCIAGPLFIFSMKDTHNNIQYKGCGPETPIFVISASVTSFFLPLLIMTIMYALTVNALQQQLLEQRRMTVTNSAGSPPRRGSSAYGTTAKRASTSVQGEPFPPCLTLGGSGGGGRAAVVRQMRGSLLHPQDYSRTDEASSLLIGNRIARGGIVPGAGPLSPKSPPRVEDTSGRFLVVTSSDAGTFDHRRISVATTSSFVGSQMALHDLDSDAFSTRSNSIQATSTSIRSPCQQHQSSASSSAASQRQQYIRSFSFRQSVSSSICAQRRGSATPDKGRRAVQVLGILFAVFVICYLPFFAVYVLKSTCSPCQPYISAKTLVVFEWLAYSGSMFNPIIYHVFNPDFRRAFHNLLHCNGRCSRPRPQGSSGCCCCHGFCCCCYGNASSRRSQSAKCRTDCV